MSRELIAQLQRARLHFAAQDGDVDLVQKLLDAKYPVNRFDDIGKTPLHYAVAGEHFEVVDLLLAAHANVNAHDERQIGNTPLSDNVDTCSLKMTQRLIEAGADPTIPGWMMMTALDRARIAKRADRTKLLQVLESAAKNRRP